MELNASDFRRFFLELHDQQPFPWQVRLAQKVCESGWPAVIQLPTASGKTAVLDVAVFAMAVRGAEVPRRVFMVVDRRVVVDEAYERMKRVQLRLTAPQGEILPKVAQRLRELGGGEDALTVHEMRGGTIRDESWIRKPDQPLVVTSTVDQTGSRLLFRGYGVSPEQWPMHAGLVGNNSLVVLDEAHCSLAFAQTLQSVQEYRSSGVWQGRGVRSPFAFVEMTATPSRSVESDQRIELDADDRANPELRKRLVAPKPTLLTEVKAKKDDFGPIAKELAAQAERLATSGGARRVAVFANRVRTAKRIHRLLSESCKGRQDAEVHLVIGRMRPIDRDVLTERLRPLKPGRRSENEPLQFVVSTQCLEVGADLDFDAIATECASIDALQQRFGRLDRVGEFGRAAGVIVISSWQIAPKQKDPVYGDALPATWKRLIELGGPELTVNMGIEAPEGEAPTVSQTLGAQEHGEGLRLLGKSAPTLLPTHIDLLSQTSPVPQPDILVEQFLHGPRDGVPDVNVVWRRDLDYADPKCWKEIVALCPPSSREAMPVQLHVFRKWFEGRLHVDELETDLEANAVALDDADAEPDASVRRYALIWNGKDTTEPGSDAKSIRPGQMIVLPASEGGWNEVGYIPEGRPVDVGDEAAFGARNSVSLRLHPQCMRDWKETPTLATLMQRARARGVEAKEFAALLKDYVQEIPGDVWPAPFTKQLGSLVRVEFEEYSDESGYAITGRRPSRHSKSWNQVTLKAHTEDVVRKVEQMTERLPEELRQPMLDAAHYHDMGKVDLRYQAWLRGGDSLAARYAPCPIAKSGRERLGRQSAAGLPRGYRHEDLSSVFARKAGAGELALHLVLTHHGHCRPFAPVTPDNNAECVAYEGVAICAQERQQMASYRLDNGAADRFWKLTREFGWWGLAYLEALFRLADWEASEDVNAEGQV